MPKTTKRKSKGAKVKVSEVINNGGQREQLAGVVSLRKLPQAKGKKKSREKAALDKLHAMDQRPEVVLPNFAFPPSEGNQAIGGPSEGQIAADVPVVDAYDAAMAHSRALLDPFHAIGARIPEPSSNIPTEAATFAATTINLPVYNGTGGVNDGASAFLLRGDTYATITQPGSIAPTTSAITWAGGMMTHSIAPYTANYWLRTVCTAVSVHVYPVGPAHTPSISWYRTVPATVANNIADGPATANVGCLSAKKQTSEGGDSVMLTGEGHDFVASKAYNFTALTTWVNGGTDRGTNSQAGWFVWLYGLSSLDRVEIIFTSHFEVMAAQVNYPPLNPENVAIALTTGGSCDISSAVDEKVSNTQADSKHAEHNKPTFGQKTFTAVAAVYKYAKANDWVWKATKAAGGAISRTFGFPVMLNTDRGKLLLTLHPTMWRPRDQSLRTLPNPCPRAGDDEERKESLEDFQHVASTPLVGSAPAKASSRPSVQRAV